MFIFGGEGERHKCLNDSYALDTKTKVWSKIELEGQITPRAELSFWSFNHQLFIFGGGGQKKLNGSKFYNDLHRIELDDPKNPTKGVIKNLNYTVEGKEGDGSKHIAGRHYHSTSVLYETTLTQRVVIVGGEDENYNDLREVLLIELESNKGWFLLHYLEAVGMIHLISGKHCRDVYELLEQ